MEKIKNTQEIASIIMKPTAYTKCRIGQDWYRNELEIDFLPFDSYPDYIEVNSFIMNEIDGHELNIEDVVEKIYNHLLNYEPMYLKVTDHIRGCKTHFDVDVTKGSGLAFNR